MMFGLFKKPIPPTVGEIRQSNRNGLFFKVVKVTDTHVFYKQGEIKDGQFLPLILSSEDAQTIKDFNRIYQQVGL